MVTFSGKLTSNAPVCVERKRILLERGSTSVGQTKTSKKGTWSITKRVENTSRFKAVFAGFAGGIYPNENTCFPSSSRRIKVGVG